MHGNIVNIILLSVSLALGASCTSSGEKNREISRCASEVAESACSELNLTPVQKSGLEEAVYFLYEEIETGTKDMTDPSDIAEVRRKAHVKFKSRLEGQFPQTEAVEILAWYYNYCNEKNKYETEY